MNITPIVSGLRVRNRRVIAGIVVDKTVDYVNEGDTLLVLTDEEVAKSRLFQRDKWIQVRTPSGMEGEIAAWLVQLQLEDDPVDALEPGGAGIFAWGDPADWPPILYSNIYRFFTDTGMKHVKLMHSGATPSAIDSLLQHGIETIHQRIWHPFYSTCTPIEFVRDVEADIARIVNHENPAIRFNDYAIINEGNLGGPHREGWGVVWNTGAEMCNYCMEVVELLWDRFPSLSLTIGGLSPSPLGDTYQYRADSEAFTLALDPLFKALGRRQVHVYWGQMGLDVNSALQTVEKELRRTPYCEVEVGEFSNTNPTVNLYQKGREERQFIDGIQELTKTYPNMGRAYVYVGFLSGRDDGNEAWLTNLGVDRGAIAGFRNGGKL